MYMNLKRNQHKRISFNTTTMISLGFIGPPPSLSLAPPPPPNLVFSSGPPPSPIILVLNFRFTPLKLGGGGGGLLPWNVPLTVENVWYF